ncbi:microtubule associated protein 1a [Dorcoceras hygrometricum]|uniref:Microtubule associated protein 1a n=1 Tax=Dorcoceras hygrometricum TaxID=472368 RepID=A0A2Z7DJ62_9LAMI|nr:microtubule associated protein 1a [Dorcoceras hygrometricum]
MQGQLSLSATEFIEYLQTKSFDDIMPPPKPHVGSFNQPWVAAHSRLRGESQESNFDILLTACVHHQFMIVDCTGARPSVVAKAKVVPHTVLYYPLDISHLGSEIENGRFSKASFELFSTVPSLFLNPVIVCGSEDESPFNDWWTSRCAVLVPPFSYPPAKGKKSIIPATSSAEHSPDKRTTVLHQKLFPFCVHFYNTDADPVDLVSSPPVSGGGGGVGEHDDNSTPPDSPVVYENVPGDDHPIQEQDAGLASEADHISIPLDLSSCRARLQRLEGLAIGVDLSFSDAGTSTSSQLVRCIPSMESLSFAKADVHNFLELGLHQLGESQRLAMISVISILRASPEFTSEYPLLDSVSTIFSDLDAAQALSTSSLAKLEDFRSKHHRVEEMEQEGHHIRAQIKERIVEYDASEEDVKKLEEQILERRAKMAVLLDEAEALERKLVSYQREAKLVAGELVDLKDKYNMWTQDLRASEDKQGECLLKWEQLRRLFS